MRKSLYLGAVLLLAMVFCGSNIFAEDVVNLRVYNYLDMSSAVAQTELDQIWGAFQKANPNIKIDLENQFNEPFHQKIQGYISGCFEFNI